MTTTLEAPALDGSTVLRLLSAFTLRIVRDIMIDTDGSLSLLSGPPTGRATARVRIRLTGPETYSVEFGPINPRTRVWTVATEHTDVPAADLSNTVRDLV
jgi:hypothetical protein